MNRSDEMIGSRAGETTNHTSDLNTTEARQGETSGRVRAVLISGLILAFIAFVLVYGFATG